MVPVNVFYGMFVLPARVEFRCGTWVVAFDVSRLSHQHPWRRVDKIILQRRSQGS